MLAMLQAFDAKLLIFAADRACRCAGDGDIRREIRFPGERIRELETYTRRRGIVVGFIVGTAEAVLLAHVLINGLGVGVVAAIETGAIGVEGRAPQFAPRHQIAKESQRLRLQGGRAYPLVSSVGRRHAALAQEIAIAEL